MEHVKRIEKERAKILRLLGEISSSFVDVTRECEKYQKELVKSSKEKTVKPAAKNAGKPAATATSGNAEEIKETIKEATKKITSVVADSGVKTIAAVKGLDDKVTEAKNETVAAVHKAKRDSHDNAVTLMEICDPEHLHHPVPKDRKRKNGRSNLKAEFIQAGIEAIRRNPSKTPSTCCRRVHGDWKKCRPEDVERTYPDFKVYYTTVFREAKRLKVITAK